ncbi:MAG: VanW family protein [Actinomycetota bacterium]
MTEAKDTDDGAAPDQAGPEHDASDPTDGDDATATGDTPVETGAADTTDAAGAADAADPSPTPIGDLDLEGSLVGAVAADADGPTDPALESLTRELLGESADDGAAPVEADTPVSGGAPPMPPDPAEGAPLMPEALAAMPPPPGGDEPAPEANTDGDGATPAEASPTTEAGAPGAETADTEDGAAGAEAGDRTSIGDWPAPPMPDNDDDTVVLSTAGKPPTGTPIAPPPDGPPVLGGSDDDPISIDGNPTTVVAAVGGAVAPPPPPPGSTPTTPPDKADATPTPGADGATTETPATDEADPNLGDAGDTVVVDHPPLGGPPVGLQSQAPPPPADGEPAGAGPAETATVDAAGAPAMPTIAAPPAGEAAADTVIATPDPGLDATAQQPAIQIPSPVEAPGSDDTLVVDGPPTSPVEPTTPTPSGGPDRRLLIGVPVAIVALFLGAWLLDSARTDGQVVRGTTLGTTPIGGLDEDGLRSLAGELDEGLGDTPVTVNVGDAEIETDAATLGARVDADELVADALAARRGGFALARPFAWVGTFFTDERIEATYLVEEAAASDAVDDINANDLTQPVEPAFTIRNDDFAVVGGEVGVRIEPDTINEDLPSALEGDAPYELTAPPLDAEPRFTDDQIAAVAGDASQATENAIAFQVLDQSQVIDTPQLRTWVQLDTEGDEPAWRIDEFVALDELKPLFPSLGAEDQQARFSVVEGEPIIIPASETVVCCTIESVKTIKGKLDEVVAAIAESEAAADENGEEQPPPEEPAEGEEPIPAATILIEPEVVGSDEGVRELESLGIIEEVSTFTTEHACCQNRVTNIQRFADLMRGVVIRPGEDFSLNEHVGQRTIAKGFVADGAIVQGVLEPQVGGGISQFATTFFNASFYAGIDFNEYQSHSLYISRYPRGREATISWRRPDLSVKNTTDYGILVWTEYTPTSITVTFYSTKHIEVEDLPLVRSSRGQCSVFTTPRVRTYPDGNQVEDSVFALYRPGEGLDCNGNSTRPEEDEPEGPTATPPVGETPAPTPEPAPDPAPAPEPAPDPEPEPPAPAPGG